MPFSNNYVIYYIIYEGNFILMYLGNRCPFEQYVINSISKYFTLITKLVCYTKCFYCSIYFLKFIYLFIKTRFFFFFN